MKRLALCLALAIVMPTGCGSHKPSTAVRGCPGFPPKRSVQTGGAFASTSFGGSVYHAPPSRHHALPDVPLDQVRIVLERSTCLGTCASYRVAVSGTGDVAFHGDGFVTFPGDHRTRIAPHAVACLVQDFRTADFWSLDADYHANVTDLPSYTLSLTMGARTKILSDYAGRSVGMPAAVTALEEAVDQVAGTTTWIRGDDKTVAALAAEHFDFHSKAAGDLLAAAARDAPDSVVAALLARGAPLNGRAARGDEERGRTATEAAAMNGRLDLLKKLIAAGAFSQGGKPVISATLRASVASQRTDVVTEVLRHHPDVNSTDERGDTALALIFTGAHPHMGDDGAPDEDAAIIRLLGKAGANPNLPNSEHERLLAQAYTQDKKNALLAIGTRPKP